MTTAPAGMEQLIAALLAERRQQRISYDELERRAGVAKRTMTRWLRPGVSPRWGNLEAVAEVLGLSIECRAVPRQ
jgi:transcriptional regulator with XRE-family HTH domain